ncbi:hypothetical protein K439DRAFT_1542728 [Ramaria rubella]|nr:hypothetical protein K439DRAFT_1542728 [Ramaria rubella]
MSSQEELAAFIQEQSDNMVFTYVLISVFVKFIWHKTIRLGTILYLLARYPALLLFLLNVYEQFGTFPSLQVIVFLQYTGMEIILFAHLGLLFARAYAISSHHKLVFVMLALLVTTAIALLMVAVANNNCLSIHNIVTFLSAIIICHFHLDLQQRNHHPNGGITSHSPPLSSFHAVTERMHRAVVDEFGDLSFNESFETDGSQQDIELQAIQSPGGVEEISLQEFPWAGGDIGDEEVGPVA